MRLLLSLLFSLSSFASTVTIISDTLHNADGTLSNGNVIVSWTAFTSATGASIAAGDLICPVNSGTITCPLVPTVGSTPTTVYQVFIISAGVSTPTYWNVPTSATPLTIAAVTSAAVTPANALIFPSQIAQGYATTGQVLGWTGSVWGPVNQSGGGGNVASVFTRTGAIIAQNGDYNTSQVTEGSNLYFTGARVLSAMAGLYQTPLTFNSSFAGTTTISMANATDPGWLTLTWGGGRITGIPSTFNAGQLQGRTVTSTSPTDTQYLGWSAMNNQWQPMTAPSLGGITPQAVMIGPGAGTDCLVSGVNNINISCPGFVASGDNTQPGAIDLKGQTSGNIVTETVDPNTAAYVMIHPSTAPSAIGQTKKYSSFTGSYVFSWDTPIWASQWPIYGAGTKLVSVDPTQVTIGNCAVFNSAFTLVTTVCPSGGGALSGGVANEFTYWTGSTAVAAHAYFTNGKSGTVYTPKSPVLQDANGCGFYLANNGSGPYNSYGMYDCGGSTATYAAFQFVDKNGNTTSISSGGSGWTSTVPLNSMSQLPQAGATTGQTVTWNGSQWAPATPATGGIFIQYDHLDLGFCDTAANAHQAGAYTNTGTWGNQCNSIGALGGVDQYLLFTQASADSLSFWRYYPSGVTTLILHVKGFPGTTSSTTLGFQATSGCISNGATFNGGTLSYGTPVYYSTTVSNTRQDFDLSVPNSCSPGDEMYVKLIRLGTFTGIYYVQDVVLGWTL